MNNELFQLCQEMLNNLSPAEVVELARVFEAKAEEIKQEAALWDVRIAKIREYPPKSFKGNAKQAMITFYKAKQSKELEEAESYLQVVKYLKSKTKKAVGDD